MSGLAERVKSALDGGDYEKAISLLRRLSRQQPSNAAVLFQMGNAHAALGDHERAIQSFNRVLRLHPELGAAHFNKANSLFSLGRFDQAMRSYESVIRRQPIHLAYQRLGRLYLDADRPSDAIQALRKALELIPDDAVSLVMHAEALHAAGERELALDQLAEAMRRWPDDFEVQRQVAIQFSDLGCKDRALEGFRNAERLRPTYAEAAYNVGYAFACLEQWSDAVSAYRRAIGERPDYYKAYHQLGHSYLKAKQFEDARKALETAIRLNPEAWESYCYLGEVLSDLGDREAGVNAYQTAIQLHRQQPEESEASIDDAYYRLWQLQGSRHGEARVTTLQAWLEHSPDNPIARHLSGAAAGTTEYARAPDDYVRAEFDGFAATFDEVLAELDYRAPNLVAEAVGDFLDRSSVRILDCGCGTGLCGPLLAPFAERLDGIDLSDKMLERARRLNVYAELVSAELTDFMGARPDAYDLVVSADTLVYFGDLARPTRAAAVALRPSGLLVFTIEKMSDSAHADVGYRLNGTGRYSHTESYVTAVLEEAGFQVRSLQEAILRKQGGEPVAGYVVVGQLSSPSSASS